MRIALILLTLFVYLSTLCEIAEEKPGIEIIYPLNATISDNTPDLYFIMSEPSNITYNWDGEGDITGCQDCTSYNVTYGEIGYGGDYNSPFGDDSLVLALNFNEGQGNRTKDDSRWGNDAIAVGTRAPQWTTGKFGYGVNTSNSTEGSEGRPGMFYIPNSTPNFNATLNISRGFTVSAWIKHPGGYNIGVPDPSELNRPKADCGHGGEPILSHGSRSSVGCITGISGFLFGLEPGNSTDSTTVTPIIHIFQDAQDHDNFMGGVIYLLALQTTGVL